MPLIKVHTRVSNGRLQLIFTHRGKRYCHSPGYPDTAIGRQYSELVAKQIQEDILKDRFDGLAKYKEATTEDSIGVAPTLTLVETWNLYVDYLRPQRSPSTMANQFKWWSKAITECPYGLDQPAKVRDWILGERTPDSARRFMVALNACGKWAVSVGHLSSNPFEGVRIKLTKKHDRREIYPFTAQERDRVIQALGEDVTWCFYQRLIAFLFFTGCRPSEAIALEWPTVSADMKFITFEQAAVINERGQIRIKKGLKRQDKRKIKVSDRVRECLSDRGNGLVFRSPKQGKIINMRNVARRVWLPVLERCAIEPRNLYQCRHTFVTLALKGTDERKGLTVQDVAKIVGNSPEVIYRYYAGTSADLDLPDW